MASPEQCPLYLADEFAGGPPEAFIDGHEFCHLHPLPEGRYSPDSAIILRRKLCVWAGVNASAC